MKLNQISKNDALTQQFIARMMVFAKILVFLEFYSMTGNADNLRKKSTAKGGTSRELGSDFASNPVTPGYANPILKIFGDKIEVDRAYERRGSDIASVRANDLLAFAEILGQEFQNQFVNGDTSKTATQFSGIKKICPSGQKITPADNGIQVTLGNTDAAKKAQQTFLEAIDQLIAKVRGGAQALMMNSKTWGRLNTLAREFVTYKANEFGILIPYYREIPIVDSGIDKAGADIITNTETLGTSTDCTSIYAVRFGERSNLTIATNIGLEIADLGLVGNFYTHSVELDADLGLCDDTAIARLEGIRL